MSTINTNTIDANYPIPGQNNSSQGFRDNFASIKQNLDVASSEITDLQNKVVLKSALANTTLNNDMANTLISNASVKSFRHTMYNLGNSLSGTVLINASTADVHYGNISANTTLNFSNWAPVDTLQTIEVQLGFANANAFVSFPANVQANTNNFGITLIENYEKISNVPTITVPAYCTQVNLLVSTTDCGASLYVEPVNRPYQSTQIQTRSPSPTGMKGDTLGTVAVDANYLYVCTGNYNATTNTWTATSTTGTLGLSGVSIADELLTTVVCDDTSGNFTCDASAYPLVVGMKVTVSGTDTNGVIPAYTDPDDFYIIDTDGSTTFQLSSSVGGSAITTVAAAATGLTFTINGFSCSATSLPLVNGQTITVSGTLSGTGAITGYSNPTTYYIIGTDNTTNFQLSTTSGGNSVLKTTGSLTGLTFTASVNYITFQAGSLGAISANMPVVFDTMLIGNSSVDSFGNIQSGEFYYVKSVDSANNLMTISDSRTAGVAGNIFLLGNVATSPFTSMDATFYTGTDIWKRISFTSW